VPIEETTAMFREKAPAFTEAMVAGTLSAVAGNDPNRVMQAALAPISETARANRIRLAQRGPRIIGRQS